MDEIQDRADDVRHANGAAAPQEQSENSRRAEKPWLFKPGQSGNPGGRPKGRSLTARLRDLLDQYELNGKRLPDGKQVADLVVEGLVLGAAKGGSRQLQEVFNRVEGKVTQRVDVTSKGGPLFGGFLDRLDANDLDNLESIADKLLAGGSGATEGGDPGGAGAAEPD
jgi:hypothetical protein